MTPSRRDIERRVDELDDDGPSTFEELFMADLKRAHGYEIDEDLARALDRGDLERAMAEKTNE